MKRVLPYQPGSFTQWWVIASLLLSLLSFSGYTGWAQIPNERAQQTELVISDRQKVKPSKYHYFGSAAFHYAYSSIGSINAEKLAELYFSTLVKLKGDYLELQYLLTKPFRSFFVHRTISQNPEEDDKLHLLIG